MQISRTFAVIGCIAAALALPAVATAQKGKTVASHVIQTKKGKQLAVPITVRYKLDGRGKTLSRSALKTRLTAAARLPGGRMLRGVEQRRVPGKASVRVEHHVFYSVRQTRLLRSALAARQKVKLAVSSASAADLDGNGSTDARSTQKSTFTLGPPSAPEAPAPIKHQQGSDPCGTLGLSSATCTNVTGSTWKASHFWDSNTWNIGCPSAYPYSANSVSTETTSKRYTQTTGTTGASDANTQVTIIDDNVRGHPVTYTPTAACTTTNAGGGGGP